MSSLLSSIIFSTLPVGPSNCDLSKYHVKNPPSEHYRKKACKGLRVSICAGLLLSLSIIAKADPFIEGTNSYFSFKVSNIPTTTAIQEFVQAAAMAEVFVNGNAKIGDLKQLYERTEWRHANPDPVALGNAFSNMVQVLDWSTWPEFSAPWEWVAYVLATAVQYEQDDRSVVIQKYYRREQPFIFIPAKLVENHVSVRCLPKQAPGASARRSVYTDRNKAIPVSVLAGLIWKVNPEASELAEWVYRRSLDLYLNRISEDQGARQGFGVCFHGQVVDDWLHRVAVYTNIVTYGGALYSNSLTVARANLLDNYPRLFEPNLSECECLAQPLIRLLGRISNDSPY